VLAGGLLMNCPMIDALHVLLQVPCGGTVCGVGNIHGTQVMVLANDGTVKVRNLPCFFIRTTSIPEHRILLVPPRMRMWIRIQILIKNEKMMKFLKFHVL
jgi:hypothetical protein